MRTGLKEGRILLAEFGQGVDDSTAALLEGTGISTQQLQSWGQAVAAGGDKGRQAMVEVTKALAGIDDETKKNALGVAIFGKQKLCRNKTGQNRWKLSECLSAFYHADSYANTEVTGNTTLHRRA